jgi:chromosome segregation ATPase
MGAGVLVLFLNQSVRSSRLGRIDEQWLQWAVQVESGLDQIKQPTVAFQQQLANMQEGLQTLQQHIDQTAEVFDQARASTQLDAHSWNSLTQSQNAMVSELQSMQQELMQLQIRFAQGGDAIDLTYRLNHVIESLNRVTQASSTTQANLELLLQRAPRGDEPGIHASVQQWNEEIQRLNRSGAQLHQGFKDLHERLNRLSSRSAGGDHVL